MTKFDLIVFRVIILIEKLYACTRLPMPAAVFWVVRSTRVNFNVAGSLFLQ